MADRHGRCAVWIQSYQDGADESKLLPSGLPDVHRRMRAGRPSKPNRAVRLFVLSLRAALALAHHLGGTPLTRQLCPHFVTPTFPSVCSMPCKKTFRVKKILAKKQNRNIPQWFRMKTNNTIRYNSKRRHWRRTKIGL